MLYIRYFINRGTSEMIEPFHGCFVEIDEDDDNTDEDFRMRRKALIFDKDANRRNPVHGTVEIFNEEGKVLFSWEV